MGLDLVGIIFRAPLRFFSILNSVSPPRNYKYLDCVNMVCMEYSTGN